MDTNGWPRIQTSNVRFMLFIIVLHNSGCGNALFNDCPATSGNEEYKQMKQYWRVVLDIDDETLTGSQLARTLALTVLQNYKLIIPERDPVVSQISQYDILPATRGYTIRVVIDEMIRGKITTGGSSFRGLVRGKTTRTPCATRDYFNGTYLMCCSVMENFSNFTLVHDYRLFEAFEVSERYLYKTIDSRVITVDGPEPAPLRWDQSSCYDVEFTSPKGYWVLLDDGSGWNWVVDGCVMKPIGHETASKCVQQRYDNTVFAMGDSHLRNLFYYLITYIDPTYINQQKVHRDMSWEAHRYFWTTTASTLLQDLNKLAISIEKKRKKIGYSKKEVLFVDMGIWQVISRPSFDYILGIELALPVLQRLHNLGVTVIWQTMPHGPSPEFDKPVPGGIYGSWRSNYVIAALNYLTCHIVEKVGVKCIPNGIYTREWNEELICGVTGTHTMCAGNNGILEITPSGFASSQMALRLACPMDYSAFMKNYYSQKDNEKNTNEKLQQSNAFR